MVSQIISILLILTAYFPVCYTGPSHITSEITPISVNEKGEIWCKTRFVKNQTGAQYAMSIFYGYCILTNGTILQHNAIVLDPNKYEKPEVFGKKQIYYDKLFRRCVNWNKLSALEQKLVDDYGFKSCNAQQYKVDSLISIDEFRGKRKVDVRTFTQHALYKAKSEEYLGNRILVKYDFGNILVLENNTWDEDAEPYGAGFNYSNPFTEGGKTFDYGYDMSKVTGVIFVKE